MKFSDIILAVAAVVTALMAGFFFSYSVSVSPGLAKLPDREFLQAMQSINREVRNLIFFLCYSGAPVMLLFAAIRQYILREGAPGLLLAAALFYLIGVFGPTALVNVPLNNKLAAFDTANAPEPMVREMRAAFEKRWAFWNNIRSVASLTSVILAVSGCIFKEGGVMGKRQAAGRAAAKDPEEIYELED